MLTTDRAALIDRIRQFPDQLQALVSDLTDAQLDGRANGEWSVRQNVHHLADSHMNAFIRTKLALAEENPTVKPYDQEVWADMLDAHDLPLDYSLSILRGLHARWSALFAALTEEQFGRPWYHPEHGKTFTVADLLATYARHGEGHLQQIREALDAQRG